MWRTAFAPPYQFTLENYQDVIGQTGIGQAFVNSLFIAIPATVIPRFVAAFAAYAFSWMEFPGRDVLFVVVVGLLVVPLQTTPIPILKLFAEWGITGEFLAVWLAHTGYGLPFAVYLLRNFMGSLPRSVFESAQNRRPDECTGVRRAGDLPVPVRLERSAGRVDLHWTVQLGQPADDGVDGEPGQLARRRLVPARRGRVRLDALPLALFFGLQRYFIRGIVGGAVKGTKPPA